MSVAALRWAFDLPLQGPKKGVLIALAANADDRGHCWSSVDRLAFYAGVTRRAVTAAVAGLEALGLIAVVHDPGRTSAYRLKVGMSIAAPPA